MNNLYEYEIELNNNGFTLIAGCDEAGRGPMAGPLVASAVILPKGLKIEFLNDSKKVSKKNREKLFDIIIEKAISYSITFIDVEEVDFLNVYKASQKAMIDSLSNLKIKPEIVLTDAMPLNIDIECIPIIHGDALSSNIAAASILAKVSRDRYMEEISLIYPEYGFDRHKGYVTKLHLKNLKEFGPCEIHRKSFAPVKKYL
ncbi:MAG: ribonuclease HII [Bacilli bacterium]|jgi:ribonuclease HII|nr:ribonuclease HII [Bacilli bacterium]MDD2681417.1 ribonuclease HII [Bacilli bacterium]MDD3121200.1 ribonuclease HII [Bacilli bacterium]MDD4062841.1 ribonuclease HII [Bacilli bacterium]MDD4481892.1 ribonuclease HII [Bacilli bacterium]